MSLIERIVVPPIFGEVIPEVIEIDVLAPPDQGFRRGTVESEVPDGEVVVYRFPSGNPCRKASIRTSFSVSSGNCAAQAYATIRPMSWPTTLGFSIPSDLASAWMRTAVVFMSNPSFGIAESPIPRGSGAITVNFSARSGMIGLHMRDVCVYP